MKCLSMQMFVYQTVWSFHFIHNYLLCHILALVTARGLSKCLFTTYLVVVCFTRHLFWRGRVNFSLVYPYSLSSEVPWSFTSFFLIFIFRIAKGRHHFVLSCHMTYGDDHVSFYHHRYFHHSRQHTFHAMFLWVLCEELVAHGTMFSSASCNLYNCVRVRHSVIQGNTVSMWCHNIAVRVGQLQSYAVNISHEVNIGVFITDYLVIISL